MEPRLLRRGNHVQGYPPGAGYEELQWSHAFSDVETSVFAICHLP